jgi:hypothetical protein
LCRLLAWWKFTHVSEVLAASINRAISKWFLAHDLLIALKMQAARISEMLVNFYQII